MAESSAERLLALIEDILDFSKIEARKVEIRHEPFDLRGWVEKAVAMFRLQAQQKGLDLRVEIDPEVPETIVGDPDRLAQVLTNLIGNAVKFTDSGGVTVRVRAGSGALEIAVADTGMGIPADRRDRLFHSFSQVDASHTRRFGGTGLGLAISKGLVELMGGEIGVESEEGRGSVFSFSLPLAVPLPAANGSPESGTVRPGGHDGGRILLAEDDPMVSELISLILRKRGWEVETAACGRQVLERWEEGGFDLVLMDVQMPTMDGFQATRIIREREPAGQHVPIIALTAHARRENQEQCLAAGMDGWLTKPVSMHQLYAAVEEQLGRR